MSENDVLFVPGSTSRSDVERCTRAIKARMNAFQRGPVFFYSPTPVTGTDTQERLEQVGSLKEEIAHLDLPSESAYMMRTSGSTSGTGKIVLLSTASLVASAEATAQALGGPGRWTTCLPPAHIAGFQTIFRSLLAKSAPVWAGRGTPDEIVQAISHYHAHERAYLSLVPVQLSRLLDNPEATRAAQRYQAILVGGAACSADVLTRAREAGLRVVQTYGMTETCGGCVYDGLSIGDTCIDISDDGHIRLSGSCVALGYGHGKRFEGTFHTADSGRINPDGKLEVYGRIDNAITSGGVTVIPEVVERHIEDIWGTRAVVVGVNDTTWGQAVIACTDKDIPDAREVLKEQLEIGWTPQRFVTLNMLGLDDFPHLSSGKPDRHALSILVERATRQEKKH